MGDLHRQLQRRRAVALALAGALAVLALLGFVLLRPATVLGIGADSLGSSVGGILAGEPCEPLPGDAWRCSHYDNQSSGTVSYRVTVDGLGCWKATRTGWAGEGGSPRRLSGCVSILDYF